MWLQHKAFDSMVGEWWIRNPQQGWPGHGFMQKLKGLKLIIKAWNKDIFGGNCSQVQHLTKELQNIDSWEESGTMYSEHIQHTSLVKSQLLSLAAKQEILWGQQCKLKWLCEGDEHTKFFHCLLAAKRRISNIVEVISNAESQTEIEGEFLKFYQHLFSKDKGKHYLLPSLQWDPISQDQKLALELPFTEEEILHQVNNLATNKSPDPNGLTAELFKKSWNTLKEDMKGVFNIF